MKQIWKHWRLFSTISLFLLLGGCGLRLSISQLIPAVPGFSSLPSVAEILPDFTAQECSVVSPKALKKVNWTRVPQINMRIRNDEFEPMIVQMTQGWPYVFRIRNRDNKPHTFNAKRFLRSMAVIRLTINGERQDETCVSSIKIPAESTAELYLVAAIDGHFEFSDNWFPSATLLSGGADGVIIVEERRETIEY